MQRNFFLTDLMKTGNHQSYERFLDTHSLPDQKIDYTGEYYTLHNYDLDSYDRRVVLIDRTVANNRVCANPEYQVELLKRVKLLHSQGFKFIMASPWESHENINAGNIYPNDIEGITSFNWTGGVSWFWWYMYDKHLNNKFKFTHDHFGSYFYKKCDFLYLNKEPREHRIKLYNKLIEGNMLSNSVYSFLGLKPPVRIDKEYELPWVDANNYPKYGMDQDIYEQP